MRDDSGEILYVGKAASLRHRLRSYFTSADDHTPHSNWNMDVVRVNREIGARSASGCSCSL